MDEQISEVVHDRVWTRAAILEERLRAHLRKQHRIRWRLYCTTGWSVFLTLPISRRVSTFPAPKWSGFPSTTVYLCSACGCVVCEDPLAL